MKSRDTLFIHFVERPYVLFTSVVCQLLKVLFLYNRISIILEGTHSKNTLHLIESDNLSLITGEKLIKN